MASHKLVSSLIRSSLRLSPSKPSISSSASRAGISSSSRASPYGYLLNRVVEYSAATAAPAFPPPASKEASGGDEIVDEYTGKGVIGRVCLVICAVIDVRFYEED